VVAFLSSWWLSFKLTQMNKMYIWGFAMLAIGTVIGVAGAAYIAKQATPTTAATTSPAATT
jgi:uncharacterized membrane protein